MFSSCSKSTIINVLGTHKFKCFVGKVPTTLPNSGLGAVACSCTMPRSCMTAQTSLLYIEELVEPSHVL